MNTSKNKNSKEFCFLIRNGEKCIKPQIAKKHLPHYECEKCIWHIHANTDREIKSIEILFKKYGHKKW